MKVLISGSSGFLGSWLVRVLSENHEVFALTRKTSSLRNLSGIKNIHIDRVEIEEWGKYVRKLEPDVMIINDWWGVSNEFRNDTRQFENVERITQLVREGLNAKVKLVIGVGSQAELGPVNSQITERDIDSPTTRYGEAKVEVRKLLEKSCAARNVRFVWMRVFSTYGPLDEGSWLIPKIVDSLLRNTEIQLTKAEQDWSYLHAYDLALAFESVLKNQNICGIVNVGNPETISIRSVALTIGKILEKKELLKFGTLEYRPDQVMKLQPLCETLTESGWYPQISFSEGIAQTIDWLQRNQVQSIITKSGQALNFRLPSRS